MKRIEHKHGGETFYSYDIELDERHTLRITPAEIAGGVPGSVYHFRILYNKNCSSIPMTRRHVQVSKEKLEKFREPIDKAIKNIEKRAELIKARRLRRSMTIC